MNSDSPMGSSNNRPAVIFPINTIRDANFDFFQFVYTDK